MISIYPMAKHKTIFSKKSYKQMGHKKFTHVWPWGLKCTLANVIKLH